MLNADRLKFAGGHFYGAVSDVANIDGLEFVDIEENVLCLWAAVHHIEH